MWFVAWGVADDPAVHHAVGRDDHRAGGHGGLLGLARRAVRRSSPRVRARVLIRLAVLGLVRCLGELSDVVIASREYAILVSETRT